MHIVNDFFSLIWQEDFKNISSIRQEIQSSLDTCLKSEYNSFCDYASIILSTSAKNIENYSKLKEPIDAVKFFVDLDIWDKKKVQSIQKELLVFLNEKGNLELNAELKQRFELLKKEEIISYEVLQKLNSIIDLIQKKKQVVQTIEVSQSKVGKNFYESAINSLINSVENLNKIIEDDSLKQRVNQIPQKLQDEKFSIGITGVMNAGKSTMLNAILGKEILGTSVIPETANLTVVKYAKTPSAKVNFWTKDEWQKIQKSAQTLENMKPFIQETKEHFKDKLDDFITSDGLSIDVEIDNLASYTSAEYSDKKCNLVKSVELYTDLKFVKDGVEIVDTPGLDDPVVQREEITKNYLYDCDMMCHLMNVNQSATQKDIEFITDTLLYQNIARLLVVITRIDTVSQDELQEVISYTKSSIKAKLQSLNKHSQIDSILQKIDFIPIAGKMALMHRTGEELKAQELGYDLVKSGILEVEDYFSDVLFGDNSQKAKLIIDSNKKELENISSMSEKSFVLEKELLSKNSSEIEAEYAKYQDEISSIKENISKLNQLINESKDELIEYFSTLENFSKNRVLYLSNLIKRRVLDDVSYEMRKNKTKPEPKRISAIINTGIKDGYIDLLREYRHEFFKKMQNSFERISRDFEGFVKEEARVTNAKDFFENYFGAINLTNSNEVLIQNVNNAIKSSSKKDIEALDNSIEVYFKEAFDAIGHEFILKTKKINIDLVNEFDRECKKPLQKIELQMNTKENILNESKNRIQDKSFDTSHRLEVIEQKLLLLKELQNNLESLGK